jgi:malate dehydrogenase (oxaloacetate-decarboxylating)(NADP+)
MPKPLTPAENALRNAALEYHRSPTRGKIAVRPTKPLSNVLFNVLKVTGGHNVTVGPVLLGAAKTAHILTPSATMRRVVTMTALVVTDVAAAQGRHLATGV